MMRQSDAVGATVAQPPNPATTRLWEIDALRGLAVVLMIVFHGMWDLHYVGWSQVDVFSLPWQIFARSIGTLFILLMGLSLRISAARMADQQMLWHYAMRRGGLLFGLGMAISLGSYLLLGASYVRFGILHLLGSALLLAALFIAAPFRVTLSLGMVLISVGAWLNTLVVPFPWLIWLGLPQAGVAMVDYYPLLPWAGVALLGVTLGRVLYPNGRRLLVLAEPGTLPGISLLRWLGRHSLAIYLLHQPIIIAGLLVLQWGARD
jgi:uncharacterized membrane protein